MRYFVFAALVGAAAAAAGLGACSSDSGDDGTTGTEAGVEAASSGEAGEGRDGGPLAADAATDTRIPYDAARRDGDTDTDGAIPDDGGIIVGGDPPAVQLVGRFEKDAVGDNCAFPGSKIVVRFKGSDASIQLTQTDGFTTGHSWFNVIVDGVLQPKIQVNGSGVTYAVATDLDPNLAHTVELEKRTEGNLGTVRFEGATFPNGGMLLGPPLRPSRRIEFLSDSTIDGFGIEGDRRGSPPLPMLPANYCGDPAVAPDYGAPPQYNNVRKSMSWVTASALDAEPYFIAYSGKGLTKNGDPADTLLFPTLYDRALPDSDTSVWGFAWKPDAVVISLGGVDFDGLVAEPAGFSASYGGLVDKIRSHYPSAWIFLTVWSQIKDDTIPTRTAMHNSLQGIIDARAADTKLAYFQFPEAMAGDGPDGDETGCEYHGNEAHHAAMSSLLAAAIKAKLNW
jgi:hypothetical protein